MKDVAENSLEAVMQILMLAVFADRRVKDEELANLRATIPTLSLFTESDLELPTDGLDALIDENVAFARDLMDDSDLLIATDAILRRITNPLLAPLVLNAMREISNVDDDFHPAEDHLLNQAITIWFD